MSGVKGRSGRKPNFPKLKQAELQDLSKYVLLNALQSNDVSTQDKIRIALVLYPHYIPAKQDITLKAGIPDEDRLLLARYGVPIDRARIEHSTEQASMDEGLNSSPSSSSVTSSSVTSSSVIDCGGGVGGDIQGVPESPTGA
jgi:hypothetical protein